MKKLTWYDNYTTIPIALIMIGACFLIYMFAGINGAFNLNDPFEQFSILKRFSQFQYLPLVIVLTPTLGACIQLMFSKKSCYSRDSVVMMMTFLTVVMVVLMYPEVRAGSIGFELPGLLGLGLSFHVDFLSLSILMVTSVLWFLVMVYAHAYMIKERRCNRFFFFIALTYSAVLGTLVSGDLLTMFLFFEMLTIASYMLVMHGQKEESYSAGYNYVFMGLVGGFSIFVAMVLIYFTTGSLNFESFIDILDQSGARRYLIFGLLIFGFGIKAGMAPVHVWLPRAHPVAPPPASALLSGIMIKVGAYGVLRVATSYYFPEAGTVDNRFDPVWLSSSTIGFWVIWLGIVTMAIGVFLALQQSNMKRMLAYHSISQMGYIVMGIGVGLYLGYYGAMGFAGSVYHIINHALFKSLLFMVAGSVYLHTKENNMYNLGGLWRKLPLSAAVALIASLGISGIPLFNGFVSKTLLHHGIVEAYQYGHGSFRIAEWIFIVISAGTVCSFIKLYYYVFLRKPSQSYEGIKPRLNSLDISMVSIALIIVFIGLRPSFLLDNFIIPELLRQPYDPAFVATYIQGISVFTISDISIMVPIVMLGFMIFFIGSKYHLFHLKLPGWLRIEYLFFYPAFYLMSYACRIIYGKRCPYTPQDISKLSLHDNYERGFLERFMVFSKMFDRRFEKNIIESDALIYTVLITIVIILMMLL